MLIDMLRDIEKKAEPAAAPDRGDLAHVQPSDLLSDTVGQDEAESTLARPAGGNLSEVLENLTSVIRERFRVKRQVRVVSAHGRITGLVLGCLPPGVALALFIIAPDHIRILVDDPMGRSMLVGGLVLQAIGVVAIRRIIQVEY